MKFGIGVDLGGTRIKAARFDLSTGRLLGQALAPTNDGQHTDAHPSFAVAIRDLVIRLETEQSGHAEVVGISAPGLADRDGTCIRYMPGKLQGLEGLVWGDYLQRKARCLNDAQAALLGEVWQGGAKEGRDVVMLTLGTGVGGAVLCNGQLLQGAKGRAGHLGHVTVDMDGPADCVGMPGSIELAIGNGSLSERSEGRFIMTRDLIAAMEDGDAFAKRVWDRSIEALAVTVAGLINTFDPEILLIGGGISNAWEHVLPGLTHWLDLMEWRPGGTRVPVMRATLGEWAGCYGAVHFADQSISQ